MDLFRDIALALIFVAALGALSWWMTTNPADWTKYTRMPGPRRRRKERTGRRR